MPDNTPDDDEMVKTPASVVAILGFDPAADPDFDKADDDSDPDDDNEEN